MDVKGQPRPGATSRPSPTPPRFPQAARWLLSPEALFLAVALAVMGPLLGPGRLYALDAPIAINRDIAGFFWGTSDGAGSVYAATYTSAVLAAALWPLEHVLPAWLVEKLWLVFLFWLCGVGASRLPGLKGAGRYYAGMLYAVNPFTYSRFVSGQWGVLAAYALLPFAVTALARVLEAPRRARPAVALALVLTAIAIVQAHGLALAVLALAVLYAAWLVLGRGDRRGSLRALGIAAAVFLVVNAFWMVRYILAGSGVAAGMDVRELAEFAARPPLQALSLRGFWIGDVYRDISDIIPIWWLLFAVLLYLAVHGAATATGNRRARWLGVGLVALGVVAAVLAAGPGTRALRPAFEALWEHVPAYRAFRDSQKFAGLLALGYAYLGAFGLERLAGTLRGAGKTALAGAAVGGAVAVVVVYALPLFGAWGQLKPATPPEEWRRVKAALDSDGSDYSVLVLPWHMYLNLPWLPNNWPRVANPAQGYFSQPVISGDNLEAGAVFSDSRNAESKYVEALLAKRDSYQEFGKLIAPLNAKYVVLLAGADASAYGFLDRQRDLEAVIRGETVSLYRNLSPVAPGFVVGEAVQVGSLQEFAGKGAMWGPGCRLYELQQGAPEVRADECRPLAGARVTREGPLSYRYEGAAAGQWVVLALPQGVARDGWSDGGAPDAEYLGMMPAFRASGVSGTIIFTRFYRLYLPLYALAVCGLVAAGALWWPRRRKEA